MQKILSLAHVQAHFSTETLYAARENLPEDPAFWQLREECRMLNGTYTPISIAGDAHMRFLHIALDGTGRVAYTKNAEKGANDIQTVTTLAAYCEKYGLALPVEGLQRIFALEAKIADYFAHLDMVRQLETEIRQHCANAR